MRYCKNPEVIIQTGDLDRRVLRFYLLDAKLVLDEDIDQHRQTKRHKWRDTGRWSRLRSRDCKLERREVPQYAIDMALEQIRSSITYSDES